MPGQIVESWDSLQQLAGVRAPGEARTAALEQLVLLREWLKGSFTFGAVLWKEGYFNALVISGGWFHDVDVTASDATVSSAPMGNLRSISVRSVGATGLEVRVTAGDTGGWHWEAPDSDPSARPVVTAIATTLRRVTGAY